MIQIDNQSRFPVYEQITAQVRAHILSGVLREGEQMPSVRTLSMDLHLNPNTVQKAYTELDRAELIGSVPGRGTFVRDGARERLRAAGRADIDAWVTHSRQLLQCGVAKEELITLINKEEIS